MNEKEKQKRIAWLRESNALINIMLESMSRKRGENNIELSHLEAQQIEQETELDVLTVGP